MFCPNCGAEVSEKAVVCIKCGVALNNAAAQSASTIGQLQPKTWLVESILVTIFCCLPFGIAGIVNAVGVSSRFGAGDVEGAKRASQQAGMWTKVAFWLGLILNLGGVIYALVVMGGLAAIAAGASW